MHTFRKPYRIYIIRQCKQKLMPRYDGISIFYNATPSIRPDVFLIIIIIYPYAVTFVLETTGLDLRIL